MHPISFATFLLVFCAGFLSAQSLVTGTIRNAASEPLSGVSVQIPGTPITAFSGKNGTYSIQVPEGVSHLTFSLLGYEKLTVEIAARSKIDVTLTEEASALNEVVVVGFGTQKKNRVTGAMAFLGESAFENVSVPVFQRALQGQMPGVVITNASGGLNAASIIRIRGVGSVSAGNQPLFVIDGIVLSDRPGSWTMGYTTNPLIGLNANDIASVEVLKDASAAAIYGARGSNGVILITTRTGHYEQTPKVNIGYYAGFSEATKRYDLLNGDEYATLFNAAVLNTGGDSSNLYTFPQPDIDWQDVLFRKGFVQESNASVSGGTGAGRYYIGATYRNEQAYMRTIGLERYSVRANFEQKLSKSIRLGLSFNPSRVIDHRVGNQWAGSAHGWATFFPPNVEQPYDANGQLRREVLTTEIGWEFGPANPGIVLEDQSIVTTTSKLLTGSYLNWTILPGLQFRTDFGIEYNQEQESRRFGKATFFGGPDGWASELEQQLFNYNWSNQVQMGLLKGPEHVLDATLGMQLTKETFHGVYADAGGFASDQLTSLGQAVRFEYANSWTTGSAFLGYFTRFNYTLRKKYLVDFTARLDGSSRFPENNRFGFFPAVAAGWIASDESFFQTGFVDFLKVRSSIGLTGNASIGDFAYESAVDFGPKYNDRPGYIIQSIGNKTLSWEKNLQWNAGIDFTLWNKRLSGTIDYYIKNTRDLLLEVPVPATNGVTSTFQNIGVVRNSGFEFSLDASILQGKLKWNVQINAATLKNTIQKLADLNGDGVDDDFVKNQRMLYRTGASIGSFFLVEYVGVDPSNGDALFYDLNGNELANQAPASNRRIVGKSLPGFTGGFTHTLQFGNFDLSAFFHFKAGHKLYLEHNQYYIERNMFNANNQLRSQLHAWTEEQPYTDVPQARLFQTNGTQPSTRYLKPASYLRLNHLTIGYTFQQFGTFKTRLRLFAAAQNLFTLTKFTGLDPDAEFYPEGDSGQGAVRYNLPAARTYTAGFSIDL